MEMFNLPIHHSPILLLSPHQRTFSPSSSSTSSSSSSTYITILHLLLIIVCIILSLIMNFLLLHLLSAHFVHLHIIIPDVGTGVFSLPTGVAGGVLTGALVLMTSDKIADLHIQQTKDHQGQEKVIMCIH